jgi:hypothetical protein
MDCLKEVGKEPVARDKLTMLAMVGARAEMHFFKRHVGIGSRSHCLSGAARISLVISSTVAGWKAENWVGGEGGFGKCGDAGPTGISD